MLHSVEHSYSDCACFSKQLKLSQPNADELGYADSVSVEEIGGTRVCCVSLCATGKDIVCASFFPHTFGLSYR